MKIRKSVGANIDPSYICKYCQTCLTQYYERICKKTVFSLCHTHLLLTQLNMEYYSLVHKYLPLQNDQSKFLHLGDNCIQNFHLGWYIVGYTVGNLVLRRRASGAVKRDFLTYIRRYTSPNENFEYGYPILMHFCSFVSNLSVASRVIPHVIQQNMT